MDININDLQGIIEGLSFQQKRALRYLLNESLKNDATKAQPDIELSLLSFLSQSYNEEMSDLIKLHINRIINAIKRGLVKSESGGSLSVAEYLKMPISSRFEGSIFRPSLGFVDRLLVQYGYVK